MLSITNTSTFLAIVFFLCTTKLLNAGEVNEHDTHKYKSYDLGSKLTDAQLSELSFPKGRNPSQRVIENYDPTPRKALRLEIIDAGDKCATVNIPTNRSDDLTTEPHEGKVNGRLDDNVSNK